MARVKEQYLSVRPLSLGPIADKPLQESEREATLIRTAKQRLLDAAGQPPIIEIFGPMVCSGQITLCFADTKVGKTIWAMQLADSVSRGQNCMELPNNLPASKVLYYDFELTDKQFEMRYLTYAFNDNYFVATLNPAVDVEFSIAQIERDVAKTEATFIVIDNIMALTANALSEQDAALKLMKQLDSLKKKLNLTIVVLAHNNKITAGQAIHRNHLAGSKVLQNYIDTLLAIGESVQSPGKRYIKHLFSRSTECMKDVLVCDIMNHEGCVIFGSMGFDEESNHIGEPVYVREEKQVISYWQELFGNNRELSVNELKDRLMRTGIKEKDAMNKMYRAKELDKPRRGFFSIKGISESNFSISQMPSNLVRIENLRISETEPNELENIVQRIMEGYEKRSKIYCVRSIKTIKECDEGTALSLFELCLEQGYLAHVGEGDYALA